MEFLRKISHTIDGDLLEAMDNVLGLLATKLTLVSAKLDKFLESPSSSATPKSSWNVRRGRYAITKNTLDKIMGDLEQWQKRFDPCWFLMMRIASPLIDQELANLKEKDSFKGPTTNHRLKVTSNATTKSPASLADGLRDALREQPQRSTSVFLPPDPLELSPILFSVARLALRHTAGKPPKQFIIDRFEIPLQSNQMTAKNDARNLARKLANADPNTFGLLKAKGVMTGEGQRIEQVEQFNFVYYVPQHLTAPISLRQILMQNHDCLHLSQQVRIARDLATSVGFVHNFNFVHKNIHPESIILFGNSENSAMSTFLVGFECFRSADAGSLRKGDADWHKDLYRHPTRQGLNPEASYVMQHDIYSLGLCLLELGLSASLVSYSSPDQRPEPGPLLVQIEGGYGDGSVAGVVDSSQTTDENDDHQDMLPPGMRKAYRIKDSMLSLAKTRLSRRMGPRYSAVVATCLTCLDVDNDDFGDESEMADEDGIIVGVRFIEKIIAKLNDIAV
ncbi:hypothetical protein PG985_013097 [Apiospora marii]|uniref:Protein kinase domain-containing protein n=1 Tax=Apiospora marii TaxID=335849 RepID=A0ABR1RDR4_9PEZI